MPIAPLDPIFQAEVANQGGMSMASIPLNDIRKFLNQRYAATPSETMEQVNPIEEKLIPTTAENETGTVKSTILRPKGSENEILPVVVYLHGGGWIFGTRSTSEKFVNDIVVRAHVAVVYVEYTLSPEVKYPIAIEECYSSILWVHENATALKVDPKKLTVLGDSAGGNMAAVESILMKQRGHGDVIRGQSLIYPASAYLRHHYESYKDYTAADYTISTDDMTYIESLYFGDKYKKKVDGHWIYAPEHIMAAPLLGTDDELKGLPRCLTITAECDVVRDEGEEYARRLTALGVDSCAVRLIGAIHGFVAMPVAETSHYRTTLQLISKFVNESCMAEVGGIVCNSRL